MNCGSVARMITVALVALALELAIFRRGSWLLRSLGLLVVSTPLLAQPVVTGITVDSLSHSDFRVTWTASGCDQTAQQIRYGFTTDYESGPGGGIQGAAGPGFTPGGTITQFGLSGLLPSTTYHVAPQSSCDGGVTWSAPVDTIVTTLPLPADHPAKPLPPPAYTPAFPDTSAYRQVTVASDCGNLQVEITAAVGRQSNRRTVITIPAGRVCAGNYFFPQDTTPAIKRFTPENISNSTITLNGHGWSSGQAVMVTCSFVGGYPIQTGNVYNGHMPSPLVIGEIYYVVNATNNTFQLSLTSDGPAITLTDTGTASPFYITQWPPYNRNAIVIQTSTPDSAFTPPGVRTTPDWLPKMATIQIAGGGSDKSNVAFQTLPFTHDIWFRGLEITHGDATSLADTTNDPAPTYGFISTTPDSSYVTFDRCYIHGLGTPNRIKYWLSPWAGHFATIQNSYMENLVYARSISLPPVASGKPGLTPSVSGNVLTVGAWSLKLMKGTTCVTSGLTWTNTAGSSTSNGYLEVGLDCTPTLILPADATATCTGNFNDGSTDHACAVASVSSPAFTLDSSGNNAKRNFTIADFPIAGGVWGAPKDDRTQLSVYNSEGTQAVYTGMGRGPFYLLNNYSSGAGNRAHGSPEPLEHPRIQYDTCRLPLETKHVRYAT